MIDFLIAGLIGWGIWTKWEGRKSTARDIKEDAAQQIARLMREKNVTPEQLANAYSKQPEREVLLAIGRSVSDIAMTVFTILGGIFVLGGIGAYIAMFWGTMTPFMHIFVTLGTGIALAALSAVAMKEGKYPGLILPVIILAALIETGGWFVFTDEMFPHGGDTRKAACFVFGIMALQHWIMMAGFRRASLLLLACIFSYGFFENAFDLLGFSPDCIGMILGGSLFLVSDWAGKSRYRILTSLGYFCGGVWFYSSLYHYVATSVSVHAATVLTGLSICSFAYGLKRDNWDRLSSLSYLVGSVIFYEGLFDWVAHTQYELLYLAVAVGVMIGHKTLGSRVLLLTSTFAIFGFIAYFTDEHFVHSVGWPVALILIGVSFFAIGAFAMRLRKTA